jgi:hypothetical protein
VIRGRFACRRRSGHPYFGFDPGLTGTIPTDFRYIRRYTPNVLDEDDRRRLLLDAAGGKKRFVPRKPT